MRPSISGDWLPESAADFETLTQAKGLRYTACTACKAPSWRDTQIVGMCEDCYDGLFEEDAE